MCLPGEVTIIVGVHQRNRAVGDGLVSSWRPRNATACSQMTRGVGVGRGAL